MSYQHFNLLSKSSVSHSSTKTMTMLGKSGITTKRKPSMSSLVMMASAMPLTAFAAETPNLNHSQPAHNTQNTQQLEPAVANFETLNVIAKHNSAYTQDSLHNSKYTQELVDVPQTVTVVTNELIEEQKAFSLVDALRNTPGITMQLGENGRSSEGDAVSLRGFSGNDLFLVDGVRNIAAVSRDTFNIESVEVTKGPAGSELGRAATGGAINLVTKKPMPSIHRSTSISVDSESKTRISADVNQPLTGSLAGRLNVMAEKGNAVNRDVVDSQSVGIAPSITWGLNTPTRVTASAEWLRQRNTPDGGIPTVGMDGYFYGPSNYTVADFDFSELKYPLISATTPEQAVSQFNAANKALNQAPKIDAKNYYGDKNDFEDVDSGVFSLFIEHDINDNAHLSNTTRYSKTEMQREVSAPYKAYNTPLEIKQRTAKEIEQGTPKKLQVNKDLAALNLDVANPASWRIQTLRQGVDRENTTLANLTNINLYGVKTGGISHDISTGLEIMQESQKNKELSRPKNVDYPSLYNPDPNIAQGNMIYNGSNSEGETTTVAGYVFDTVSLTKQLQVVGGVRIDDYDTTYKTFSEKDGSTRIEDGGTLVSYKGAVVFKPTDSSSVYANYSHTETPPGSSNFSLSNTGGIPSANPIFDPQKTNSWEIGTKWKLLDERLLMTLAYYNTKHEDELAKLDGSGDGSYIQFGERTVDGFELTAQGELTPKLNINVGIQTMDTKIKEGTSGRNAEGAVARWSPELTGTVWSSYQLNDKLAFGGGVRYVDEQIRQTEPGSDFKVTNMPVIPEYWAVDAFVSYKINDSLSADLNVYNLLDEDYIDSLNSGGVRAIKGEPLNGMLTLKYEF